MRIIFLCNLLFPIFLYAQRDSTYTSLESALSNPDQVYSLFIAYKNIETLPEEIGLLKNLEHLYAFSNKISKLPESFKELKNLKSLNLFGNQFKDFPEEICS
jgi:Leucine-rich repeat (LRR) protein